MITLQFGECHLDLQKPCLLLRQMQPLHCVEYFVTSVPAKAIVHRTHLVKVSLLTGL